MQRRGDRRGASPRRATASWRRWLTRFAARALTLFATGCTQVPDLVIHTAEEPKTTESGGTMTISVRLEQKPDNPVKVHGESSDPGEGEVMGELWFDQNNWNVTQLLTVRGVDDEIQDGDIPYDVRIRARPAGNPVEQSYLIEEVSVVNEDNDGGSFLVLDGLPFDAFGSEVVDMSDEGDIIVGHGTIDSISIGFYWTADTGMHTVSGATGVTDVSPNGQLILGGEAATKAAPFPHYLVWTDGEQKRVIAPVMSEPTATHPLVLFGSPLVLDDGDVFGSCRQYGEDGQPFGCRIDPKGVIAPFGSATSINVADLAGNYGGGRDGDPQEPGTRAILNGTVLGTILGCDFASVCTAEVVDFSADARVVIGNGLGPPTGHGQQLVPTAFVHTAANPMRPLPDLPGGIEARSAYAVSDDGEIIGGLGNDEDGQHAVLWIGGEPHRLVDLLMSGGAKIPPGYRLQRVTAMSADGSVFAGNGLNARGEPQGFRAFLPRAP